MIKIHLSKILGAKRINMTELAALTNISRNSIYLLYHEKSERIDLKTIERLCAALNCQPGDLLEYVPEK